MKSVGLLALLLFSTLFVAAQPLETANLIVVRNEDNGKMNILPCRIYIETEQGRTVVPEQVTVFDLSGKPAGNRIRSGFVYLVGGDTAKYILKPGKYRITARTPIVEQDKYLEEQNREWSSEVKTFEILRENIKELFVFPKSVEAFYSGGWKFSLYPNED